MTNSLQHTSHGREGAAGRPLLNLEVANLFIVEEMFAHQKRLQKDGGKMTKLIPRPYLFDLLFHGPDQPTLDGIQKKMKV